MSWIIVIISLAAMLLGFIPMSAVDRFNVARNRRRQDGPKPENTSVLVYGRSEEADRLGRYFAEKKRPFDQASIEAQVGRLKKYGVIFILGSDDYDNLLTASKFDMRFPEARQILLCNDQTYIELFRRTGKRFILKDDTFQVSTFLETADI